MTEQFQNPAEVKVEEQIASESTSKKKIDHIADEAAKKATKTEQKFDKDNQPIFSR
jgi:hypothetical protein